MRNIYARVKEPFLVFVLFCVLAVAVRAASIGPGIYTDYNSWLAALGGSPDFIFNFDDAAHTPLPYNYNGLYLDVGGNALAALDNGFINASFGDTSGFLNFSMNQPFTAMGFDVFNTNGLINFSYAGQSYLLSDGFFGIIQPGGGAINFGSFAFNGGPIITSSSAEAGFLIDNVAVKVVPEPQTLVLFLIGLGAGVQVYRRRIRTGAGSASRDSGDSGD